MVVLIDDILIYSRSVEEHEKHLRLVLLRLWEKKLSRKLKKCEFWLTCIAFLGYVISKEGVFVDLTKIETIVNWS